MSVSRKDMTRRGFLLNGSLLLGGLSVGPSVLGLSGCHRGGSTVGPALLSNDSGPDGQVAGDIGFEAAVDAAPEAAPVVESVADPRDGFAVRMDLRQHLHLADIDHHGQFIEFGTPSRFKYTLGNWRSGWGTEEEEDGTRFTWAGASPARMYVHLDRPTELRFGIRVRPGSSDHMSVYVNDHAIERINLPSGWSEQWITVDARHTEPGENALKLVHNTRSGRGRSFAVQWIRLVPGAAEPVTGEDFVPPTVEALSREMEVLDETRTGFALRAPSRVSWFLEIPPASTLGFSTGLLAGDSATATVRVTDAQEGTPREVYQLEHNESGGWRNGSVDLSEHGGNVVRLDIEVTGDGDAEVGFATPALLARPSPITAAPAEPVRNVVVILIDTLRADKLRSYGRTRVETPEMERFVGTSTLFQRCQAPSNWTKPSCASVLTGLHPPTHRALSESSALPRSVTMCSEVFQGSGFRTAALIANGYLARDFGFGQGWNLYRNYIRERRRTEAEGVYDDAIDWMERNREERMFVYIQTIDPHVPYDPPSSDLRRYDAAPYSGPVRNRSTGHLLEDIKRGRVTMTARDRERLEALYDGEVTYHDRHFGRFMTRLEELGLLDSTMFVVTSDHGEEFFEHDSVGHGHNLYQELLHVPLIMRWPGVTTAGQRLGQVCSLVDITPTILDATGLEAPAETEGRSLVPDLRGAPPPVNSAAFSSQWDTGNNRELGWTARIGDWKLRMRGPANTYLNNLATDPRERRDLDEDNPVALRATRIALGQFLGSPSLRHWAAAAPARGGRRPSARPRDESATMSPELCEQLRALGYLDIEACE